MVIDVRTLSEKEVLIMADLEAEKIGFRLMAMKKLKHDGDYYLRYVLCESEGREEFATWLFNVECGGFHHGHYFQYWNISKEEARLLAIEDFNER